VHLWRAFLQWLSPPSPATVRVEKDAEGEPVVGAVKEDAEGELVVGADGSPSPPSFQ